MCQTWTTKYKTIVAAFSFTALHVRTIYEFDSSTLETVGAPFKEQKHHVSGLSLFIRRRSQMKVLDRCAMGLSVLPGPRFIQCDGPESDLPYPLT